MKKLLSIAFLAAFTATAFARVEEPKKDDSCKMACCTSKDKKACKGCPDCSKKASKDDKKG